MAAEPELALQIPIVVYLPVEDRKHALVFVGDRLPAADDVNDAEPPHAEGDLWREEISILVRPAMTNSVAHPLESRWCAISRRRTHPSGDPAHQRAFTMLGSVPVRRKTNSLHPTVPPAVLRRRSSKPRWRK